MGWKERGAGMIKLNKMAFASADRESTKDKQRRTAARLLMRNNATHKTILNAGLYSGMPIGDPLDIKKRPSGNQMQFAAPDEQGLITLYRLKVRRARLTYKFRHPR